MSDTNLKDIANTGNTNKGDAEILQDIAKTGDKTKIGDFLEQQLSSLKTINRWFYAILAFAFILVVITFVNTFTEFRAHLCIYSNTRKCLASNKYCPTTSDIRSDPSTTSIEFITIAPLTLTTDTSKLSTTQTLNVETYQKNAKGNVDGDGKFLLDFNFTESLPSSGTSPFPQYTDAGYMTNSSGISFYMRPFVGFDTLSGTSQNLINNIISEGMHDAGSSVLWISNPINGYIPKNSSDNKVDGGVVYISGQNNFNLGTYSLTSNATLPTKNSFSLTSSLEGSSSFFNNFDSTKTIPLQVYESSIYHNNITSIIGMNNQHSRDNCSGTNKTGCACIDPGLIDLPPCENYTYDAASGYYNLINSNKHSAGTSLRKQVKFCSYFAQTGTAKNPIQLNVPTTTQNAITGQISGSNKPIYYPNGFGNGTSAYTNAGGINNRYNTKPIFCSSIGNLTSSPQTNNLYTQDHADSNYSGLGTAYGSSQPNAFQVGNNVVLGHSS